MVCTYCGSKTKIINSRHQRRTNSTWRRRQCLKCQALMTTVEQLDYAQLWVVSESRSIFEPFLRDKLFLSLYDSLKHRKTAISDSLGLTASIIAKLSGHNNGQISKKQLIETSLTVLKHFDKVAAIHYQAYYGQLN